MAAGQLSKFYHKVPGSFKFAQYKPSRLACVGAMLEVYCKLKTKPKTIAEVKEELQVI